MCERGVFRHELFDGTTEYHICDSIGVLAVTHVSARVPKDFIEMRLNDFLNAFEPDGGTSLPASSERTPLHLCRGAAA